MATLIKLVIIPAIFFPFAILFGFRNSELVAILVMLGSPTTVSCYIMAKNMNNDAVLTSSIDVYKRQVHSIPHIFLNAMLLYYLLLFSTFCIELEMFYNLLTMASPISIQPTSRHPSDMISTVRYPSSNTFCTAASMASASASRFRE